MKLAYNYLSCLSDKLIIVTVHTHCNNIPDQMRIVEKKSHFHWTRESEWKESKSFKVICECILSFDLYIKPKNKNCIAIVLMNYYCSWLWWSEQCSPDMFVRHIKHSWWNNNVCPMFISTKSCDITEPCSSCAHAQLNFSFNEQRNVKMWKKGCWYWILQR